MRKIDIQDLIQLLGMVGIIGSLIFVGLEMKQSQSIALAGQQALRTQFFWSFSKISSTGIKGCIRRHYGIRSSR